MRIVMCAALLAVATLAQADETAKQRASWKLTIGDYRYEDYSGVDLNLRWRDGNSDAWIGTYRDREFGSQSRVGFDTAVELTKDVQLQPSLQLASRGFVGGSVNLQVGDAWFAFVGLGRTNLKPYFNLNFDPNDAATYGIGHRTDAGDLYTAFVVADDRLGTHQQDWHLNARIPVRVSRVTFDLMYKQGLSDAGPITAWGYSATWDWPRAFVRVARDPYQNFSAQDAWRFATGVRF